jgi:HPt (histidine-containing phosphotransfer) domain-containing protein
MKKSTPATDSQADFIDYDTLEALSGLSSAGEPNFLSDLVESYISDGERVLAQLEQAAACRDVERFRRLAHELKGTSSAVGGSALSRICEHLEDFNPDQGWRNILALLAKTSEVYRITSQRLREEAAKRKNSDGGHLNRYS